MRIASFIYQGRPLVGLVSADATHVTPLALSEAQARFGALALIDMAASGIAWPEAAGPALALADLQLQAPMPQPRRNLFCVGRNYHAHARELSASVFKDNDPHAAGWPMVFTKVPECVVATGTTVRLPSAAISSQIDYEAELAVVIGKGGRNIGRAAAMDHVFGYTIVNDVTARDVQMRHGQWDLGKSFDTFCPMGPWLVTADELDGRSTQVRCWVTPAGGSEELRQDANTRDLIHDIPSLIETCSRGITLYPGDIIATGTAAGVGMGMTPQRWLGHGDVVRISIDGLGELVNRFELAAS